MAPTPSHLYKRKLTSKANGLPLFFPEPSLGLPLAYQLAGVQLGDVGVWHDDAFQPIFNICNSTLSSPLNERFQSPRDLPLPLFPLRSHDVVKSGSSPPGSIVSGGYEGDVNFQIACSVPGSVMLPITGGAGLTVKRSLTSDAQLYLPDGAFREELLNSSILQAHVKRFRYPILSFARSTGLLPPNRSLFVVTSTDKTCSWEIRVRSRSNTYIAADARLEFLGASASASTAIGFSVAPQARIVRDPLSGGGGAMYVRSSDDAREPKLANHCVFVKGFELSPGIIHSNRLRGPIRPSTHHHHEEMDIGNT